MGRPALSVLVLGAALGCAHGARSGVEPAWLPVWSDEFDGAAGAPVDTAKWRYVTAVGFPRICGW